MESAIEGGAELVDDAGRERILAMCRDLRKNAERLSQPERQQKIQAELQKAALGTQPWQAEEGLGNMLPELACPRGSMALSLCD